MIISDGQLQVREETVQIQKDVPNPDRAFKIKAAVFLTAVTGISGLIGFGSAIAAAKKQDPKHFEMGLIPSDLKYSATGLAVKALAYGTLCAVTGCGFICYTIWKISGARDLKDFRQIMGSKLPNIPKNDPPQGRTEFSGMNDLLTYISEQSKSK